MRPAARVATAIELLQRWDAAPSFPFDRVAHADLAQRRYAGSKDRAAILDLAFEALRRRAGVDRALEALGVTASWRLRVLAALDAPPATLADGGPHGAPPPTPDEARWLAAVAEAPRALLPPWLAEAIPAADHAGLELPAPVDLRALPGTRDALAAALEAQATPHSPWGVRLARRGAVEAVAQGAAEVQDEGSQLIVLAALPVDGLDVLDRCAGAGGKALALADAGRPRRLVAADVSADRLRGLDERLQRRMRPVERRVAPPGDRWLASQRFDVVLVDAPCSGTGTLRRAPDLAWRLQPHDVARFAATQDAVLAECAPLVRPGGRLLYATCSLLAQENEDRVAAFLAAHPDFASDVLPLPLAQGAPSLRLSPARTGTDGFFIAALRRIPAS